MSANTMMPKLSFQNCNRNRPAMRHAFQDTAIEFETERHEFINMSDVEGAYPISYDSHPVPTGLTRVGIDSPLVADLNLLPEERVWRIHGESGFHIA